MVIYLDDVTLEAVNNYAKKVWHDPAYDEYGND
jgi:hypothetical protein